MSETWGNPMMFTRARRGLMRLAMACAVLVCAVGIAVPTAAQAYSNVDASIEFRCAQGGLAPSADVALDLSAGEAQPAISGRLDAYVNDIHVDRKGFYEDGAWHDSTFGAFPPDLYSYVVSINGTPVAEKQFRFPEDCSDSGDEELTATATCVGQSARLTATLAYSALPAGTTLTLDPSASNMSTYDEVSIGDAVTMTGPKPSGVRTFTGTAGPGVYTVSVAYGVSRSSGGYGGAYDRVIHIPNCAAVIRLAGVDRYATSAAITANAVGAGVPVVYIAKGSNFPDALSGAPVAGVQGGAVLLTDTNSIPAPIKAELVRLKPAKIVVLGSTASVSAAVFDELPRYTASGSAKAVSRLEGADRYATSAAISARTFSPGVPVAYLAKGTNFPDALSAAPVAAMQGAPVLLTGTDAVPAVIADELARLKPKKIVVLGSAESISEAVFRSVAQYSASGSVSAVERISGVDRYATSAAISQRAFSPGVPVVYLARGTNFPDALSGAPIAGIQRGPVLLTGTDAVPAVIAAELTRLKPRKIVVLGSDASVSDAVFDSLDGYLSAP
ncbi:cell wall-binding repeat-containing protein [Microbacterium sp. 1P10UB]|uniref:cell wall-binding repeat-containing protein n=1 Tax=unclassified Microbacterium TaxID=2609290 RepID=UPI00399F62D1